MILVHYRTFRAYRPPVWRKRYYGPGYPVDPANLQHFDEDQAPSEYRYTCVLQMPTPETTLHSETWTIPVEIQTIECLSDGEDKPWMTFDLIRFP